MTPSTHKSKRLPVRAIYSFCDKGFRPVQEDYLLLQKEKGVFVISDGFGGPEIGSLASRLACESVVQFLVKEAGDLDATLPFVLRSYFSLAGNVLFNSLVFANRKLNKQNEGKNVHERGGASVLAAYLDGDLLAIANVGLCTAWLLREQQARELVVPRSYGRLKDPFCDDPPSEWRIPLMALGIVEDLEPEIFEYRVSPGDWLLLSTDGLDSTVRKRILDVYSHGKNQTNEAKLRDVQIILNTCDKGENMTVGVIQF